jgi:folate-binding protein YgfZ
MPACVLNTKGKIDAFIFVSAGAEDLFIDSDGELRETLLQRLDRYVIADDVTIEDVTEQFSLFHVTDETAPTLPNDANWRRAKRFGTAGWDLVIPSEEHDWALQCLAANYSLCDAPCAERLRIEQGIPRWGHELTDQIIPVEANLADDAIDYAKGCYIGQEVISRMKMSGQMNKRLCGLVALKDAPLAPGMRLHAADVAGGADPSKDVGWITSATRSDRLGKEIALGYVKRGFNQPGTKLLAEEHALETVALPFL